jgi:glycosyltransferase involved in cell wall biosynthesis
MKTILNISIESKLFDKDSRVYSRIKHTSLENFQNYFLVFTHNLKYKDYESSEDNFHVLAVYGSNKFVQIINLFETIKKLSLEQYIKNFDFISAQDSFEIGFISYLISLKYKSKLIVQMHTDTSTKYFRGESMRNYIQFLISLFAFKKAHKIRVVSDRMESYLISKLNIDEAKIINLPLFVDLDNFKFNFKSEKKVDFLVLCRIEKVKNTELTIESIKYLNKKRKEKSLEEHGLKIVGDGSYKKYLQENFKDNFITWVPYDVNNVQQEYNEARVSIISSLYEGYAVTAVEAVASGAPVAMTDVGCAGDFIIDGINGFISEDFDIINFANTLEKTYNFKFDEILMKESLKNINNLEEYKKKASEIYSIF